jgi:hypothetical protein
VQVSVADDMALVTAASSLEADGWSREMDKRSDDHVAGTSTDERDWRKAVLTSLPAIGG